MNICLLQLTLGINFVITDLFFDTKEYILTILYFFILKFNLKTSKTPPYEQLQIL